MPMIWLVESSTITVLKDTIDAQYANDQLIILGDYNDDVTTSIGGGASTYSVILNDSINFEAITESLSLNQIPTFIRNLGSTIDHITISSELQEEYIDGSEGIYFPFNDIVDYERTTSDHLPVLARFEIVPPVPPLASAITETQTVFFGYDPAASAQLEVEVIGGFAPYSYQWSTGETTPSINVAPQDTTLYFVQVTDQLGNTIADTTQVNVVDVTCEIWGRTNTQVCFRGRNLCVPEHVAERLIEKGASLGNCNILGDQVEITNIEVFPNPFRDNLTIGLSASDEATLTIKLKSFFQGNTVFEQSVDVAQGINERTFDLSHLNKGLYVLVVRNTDTGRLEKILTVFKK